jgi:hypothetical protein
VTKHSDITCCLRNTSDSDYTLNLTIKHDVQVLIGGKSKIPTPPGSSSWWLNKIEQIECRNVKVNWVHLVGVGHPN